MSARVVWVGVVVGGFLAWWSVALPRWGCSFTELNLMDRLVASSGVVVSCVGGSPLSGGGCHVDIYGEFDSGSGRTLAACLTHASRTVKVSLLTGSVANG